jgi:hypothetical protein
MQHRTRLQKLLMGTLCALLAMITVPFAQAQFDSASVLGTIKDQSGSGIPSATVVLLSPAKGVSVQRQTDSNGNYEFSNVQPGEYSISVTAANFEKADTGRFTVTVGARQRVELTLKIGTDAQTVNVSRNRYQRSRGDGRDAGSGKPAAERPRVRGFVNPGSRGARVAAGGAVAAQPRRLVQREWSELNGQQFPAGWY